MLETMTPIEGTVMNQTVLELKELQSSQKWEACMEGYTLQCSKQEKELHGKGTVGKSSCYQVWA